MLKMRIQILEQAEVIGSDVAAFMYQVIDLMGELYPEMEQETAEMFTTHLAMATQRIKTGESVETMDDAIWAEIMANEKYPDALYFLDRMMQFCPVQFPESERRFMLLHICSMLSR